MSTDPVSFKPVFILNLSNIHDSYFPTPALILYFSGIKRDTRLYTKFEPMLHWRLFCIQAVFNTDTCLHPQVVVVLWEMSFVKLCRRQPRGRNLPSMPIESQAYCRGGATRLSF